MSLLRDTLFQITNGKLRDDAWANIDGPCCIHNGETADTRNRCGIMIHPDDTVTISCFNCKFKTRTSEGKISSKLKSFLEWCGTDKQTIDEIYVEVYTKNKPPKTKSSIKQQIQKLDKQWYPSFNTLLMPKTFKHPSELNGNDITPKLMKALEYAISRVGEEYVDDLFFDIDVNSVYHHRMIIPFYYENKFVGWSSRTPNNYEKVRYVQQKQTNFIYNADQLRNYDRKHVILVEGAIDAFKLGCMSLLGSNLNEHQAKWLKSSGKEIIVVPDTDKQGYNLGKLAEKYGFSIAVPQFIKPYDYWHKNIKDVSDSIDEYGKLYTYSSIVEFAKLNKQIPFDVLWNRRNVERVV